MLCVESRRPGTTRLRAQLLDAHAAAARCDYVVARNVLARTPRPRLSLPGAHDGVRHDYAASGIGRAGNVIGFDGFGGQGQELHY